MKQYAGLDLSMETTHVCVVDGEDVRSGRNASRARLRGLPRRWSDMGGSIAR